MKLRTVKVEWRVKGQLIEFRYLERDKHRSKRVNKEKWRTIACGSSMNGRAGAGFIAEFLERMIADTVPNTFTVTSHAAGDSAK